MGWVDYRWMNPVTRRVEPKSTYFERDGDLVYLCGIYRAANDDPRTAAPALATGRQQLTLAR